MSLLRIALVSISCAILVACAGASSPSANVAAPSGSEPQVASVWRSKCGSCHVPVEPGSHARDELETALKRHRKRVRLSDEQWSDLVNFLAASQATSQTSPEPKQEANLQ